MFPLGTCKSHQPTNPNSSLYDIANISVALVGPSGCGKSTTVQMLERFYDPLIGKVTLDGVDIREINVSSYRSEMALVSQEPTLYAGTVRFNVVLGASKPMEQVTDEEVVKACKDANIVSGHGERDVMCCRLTGSTTLSCPCLMDSIRKSEEKDRSFPGVK